MKYYVSNRDFGLSVHMVEFQAKQLDKDLETLRQYLSFKRIKIEPSLNVDDSGISYQEARDYLALILGCSTLPNVK